MIFIVLREVSCLRHISKITFALRAADLQRLFEEQQAAGWIEPYQRWMLCPGNCGMRSPCIRRAESFSNAA